MVDGEAVFLGLVPPLAVILVAVSVPVPPGLSAPGVLVVLIAGPAGGYVAGTMAGGDRRRRARHGLASGAVAGLLFGPTLAYAIYESAAPTDTLYWWIHYAVATTTPPDVVVAYGYYILVGIGVVATGWYALGAAAGAALTGGESESVETGDW